MRIKNFWLIVFYTIVGCASPKVELIKKYNYPLPKMTESVKTTMEKLSCDSVVIYEKGETPHMLFVNNMKFIFWGRDQYKYTTEFFLLPINEKTQVRCVFKCDNSDAASWPNTLIFPALSEQINIEKTGKLLISLEPKSREVFISKSLLMPLLGINYLEFKNPYAAKRGVIFNLLVYELVDIIGIAALIGGIHAQDKDLIVAGFGFPALWRVCIIVFGDSDIKMYNKICKTGYNFGLR